MNKNKTIAEKQKEHDLLLLDDLIEKKFAFEKKLIIAYNAGEEFSLKQQIKELEKEIEELKRKIK